MDTRAPDRAEGMKALIWRYYDDCWHRGDFAIVDAFAGDFQACTNNLWTIQEADGIKASMGRPRAAFPDLRGRIDDWFIRLDTDSELGVVCDKVTIWWTIEGTFAGALEGIPPTGKRVKINGSSLLYLKDDKLIAARAVSDIYQAVGAVPREVAA